MLSFNIDLYNFYSITKGGVPQIMKTKYKILLLVISLMTVVSLLVSCADNNKKNNNDNPFDDSYYDDSSRERARDNVPAGYKLDGDTVTILYPGHVEDEVIGRDDMLDLVYTNIHDRNIRVKGRLNCELNFYHSGTTDWKDFSAMFQREMMSRNSDFDIVISTNNTIVQNQMSMYFQDLNYSQYVDIGSPWWNESAILEMSIDGYNYRFLYGDITISTITSCGAIFYNKQLYEQQNPGKGKNYLYQMVFDGTWTMEEFYRIAAASYIEKSSDPDLNTYGFYLFRYAEPIHHFAVGANISYYERNALGYPQITINNERSADFTVELYNLLYQNRGARLFYPNQIGKELIYGNDFVNDRVMFSLSNLSAVLSDEMREMQSDFGILPYPKYDVEQEEYYTLLHNSSSLVGIPYLIPPSRADYKISAVLEALSAEAYRTVSVSFYETALKSNYTRDDDASKVIDIIVETSSKNFLYEYSSSMGGIGSIFSTLMSNKSYNFASQYATMESVAKTGLDKLISEYRNTQ